MSLLYVFLDQQLMLCSVACDVMIKYKNVNKIMHKHSSTHTSTETKVVNDSIYRQYTLYKLYIRKRYFCRTYIGVNCSESRHYDTISYDRIDDLH